VRCRAPSSPCEPTTARLYTLRSSIGAPLARFLGGSEQKSRATCSDPAAPALGCGSVVHGINFDFDSAALRGESAAALDALHRGPAADKSSKVVIEGHTSSEGEAAYNQRLAASGAGETRPIAPNDDESGRSLNRRVEIHCAG